MMVGCGYVSGTKEYVLKETKLREQMYRIRMNLVAEVFAHDQESEGPLAGKEHLKKQRVG